MTTDELNKLIKGGNISGVFLFYGEEQYLLESKITTIAQKIVTPGTEEFNILKFNGKETNAADIITAADRVPTMSAMKLIVVKDSGLLNNATLSAFKLLREATEHFPTDTCLIFAEPTFDKKKLKNVEFIAKSGGIVNFEYIPLNKLSIWLVEYFKKHEKVLTDKDAAHILRLCGQSLGKLKSEADKVIGYLGDRTRVTLEDIDAVVSKTVDFKIYELVNAMTAGQKKAAHEQLKYLQSLSDVTPHMVLSRMMARLSELLMCKRLKEDGLSAAEISDYFDFKQQLFVVNKTITESRRFGEKYLKRMIDKGLYYDVESKSGRLPAWAAVEMYLAELVK